MGRPTNIQQVCKIIELISAWHTWTTHRMHCTVQSHCHLDNNKRNVQQGAKHACLRSYTIIRAGLSNFLFTRHVSQLPWRSSLLPCCYMSLVLALTPSNPSGLVFLEQRYSEPSHRRSKTSEQTESSVAVYLQLYERWSLIEDQSTSAHRAHISIRFTVSDPFINLAL